MRTTGPRGGDAWCGGPRRDQCRYEARFRDHTIVVDVNGGGRGKKRFLDHCRLAWALADPKVRDAENQGRQMQPEWAARFSWNSTIDSGPDARRVKQLLSPCWIFEGAVRVGAVVDTLPRN